MSDRSNSYNYIPINTLSGGVSRLPDTKRMPNEAEDLTNCIVNPENSLLKRAPFELVEFPGTVAWEDDVDLDAYYVTVERDNDEVYLVRISETLADPIRITNVLNQTVDTVTIEGTTASYLGLGTSAPKDKLSLATLFDGSVIVNKEAVLAWETDTALGGGEIRYENETNDGTFVDTRITTTDANYPGQIFDNLTTSQNLEDYSYFEQPPTTQDLTAHNGVEGTIGAGKVYYARNTAYGNPAGYYKAVSNTAQPWYDRIRTQEANSYFDNTTFPHLLFNDSIGNWTFDAVDWNPRLSGTQLTNPGPTALGRTDSTISAASVWRNRLWFASGPTLFSSEANNLFNLWLDDADNITSDDAIDVTAATNRVANITSMLPFTDVMFCSTDNKLQFEVQGSNNLISPQTAAMSATSFYGTTPQADPVALGSVLFFMDSNRLYLYAPQRGASVNQATEMSYHARDYLPKNPRLVTPVEFQNSLCWIDGDNPNRIFWYAARFNGNEQVQSAFFKWELDDDYTIQHMFVVDTDLYVVAALDGKTYLLKADLETLYREGYLDGVHEVTGVYADGKTTFTSKMPLSQDAAKRCIVLTDAWGAEAGTVVDDTDDDRNTVVVTGDYTAHPVQIGNRYEMRATLSRQYVRDETSNIVTGQVMLKNVHVMYEDSGHFDVEVVRAGRELSKSLTTVDNFRLAGQVRLGESKWIDGEYTARVTGDAYHTQVSLVSSYPEPVNVTQMEFAVNFERGKRTSLKS